MLRAYTWEKTRERETTQEEINCCLGCPLDDCQYDYQGGACPLRALLGRPHLGANRAQRNEQARQRRQKEAQNAN